MIRLNVKEVNLPEKETHYRYSDYHYEDGLMVKLLKFYSVKETECFHYVVDEWSFHNMKRWNFDALSKCGDKFINVRKVGKKALRSYCYQSKVLALNSFEKRKISQLFHAQTAISKATLALEKVSTLSPDEVGESINCGLDDHLQTFIFD
jgi:hypothetical protein